MDNIYISIRKDGMGSHFFMNIAEFLLSKYLKKDLYHISNYRMYDGNKIEDLMYFRPIIKNSIPAVVSKKNYNKIKYFPYPNLNFGIKGPPSHFCEIAEQDIVSYFSDKYKKTFYSILKDEALKKKFILPWDEFKNIICINIRLEEDLLFYPNTNKKLSVSHKKDYDGSIGFNYTKNLIENKKFNEYKKEKSRPHDQCPISPNKLINFIEKFQKEYPKKKIYIITYCRIIPNWLNDIIKKYNINIFHNNDKEYDLWLMIHCDILVLSKSTYSNIAGLYHQGSIVFYPYYSSNACWGLGSKYDKSNWIGYI